MQRFSLYVFIVTLSITGCKKDNNTSEISFEERLTADKWTYELLETFLYVNDVLTEHQVDIGGCYEFSANGIGKITYSNADFDNITWSSPSEQKVVVSVDGNANIEFDVLVNESNRQEWQGTATDGQNAVMEVVLKMTK